jgi:hypothetical protein
VAESRTGEASTRVTGPWSVVDTGTDGAGAGSGTGAAGAGAGAGASAGAGTGVVAPTEAMSRELAASMPSGSRAATAAASTVASAAASVRACAIILRSALEGARKALGDVMMVSVRESRGSPLPWSVEGVLLDKMGLPTSTLAIEHARASTVRVSPLLVHRKVLFYLPLSREIIKFIEKKRKRKIQLTAVKHLALSQGVTVGFFVFAGRGRASLPASPLPLCRWKSHEAAC